MSTKVTINHHSELGGAAGFHLYKDIADDNEGPIYLELADVAFEATHLSIKVTIPRDWANMLGLI